MRFLTIFFSAEKVHLYKDVGMIPYALAKYCGYQSSLIYVGDREIIDREYTKFVDLIKIPDSKISWLRILLFIYKHANQYDVINVYHLSLKKALPVVLFKFFNARCRVYLKLDLDQMNYDNIFYKSAKRSILNFVKRYYIHFFINLITVETFSYYEKMKQLPLFDGKLQYLPNGIEINDLSKNYTKEKIILFMGRVGTYQKNNELLIDALEIIPAELLTGWKVIFVGPVEERFKKCVLEKVNNNSLPKDLIFFTGNISEKEKLYEFYKKSAVFCLTSRWEGFSLVLPEAMYFENYIISTNFAAAYDILDNGKCGSIIQSENVQELAECLVSVLKGEFPWHSRAKEGRKRAEELFIWKKIIRKLAIYLGG